MIIFNWSSALLVPLLSRLTDGDVPRGPLHDQATCNIDVIPVDFGLSMNI